MHPFHEESDNGAPPACAICGMDKETHDGWVKGQSEQIRRFIDAYCDDTDAETNLSDLLADLMHYAEQHKIDFDAAFARGARHWKEERLGPERQSAETA